MIDTARQASLEDLLLYFGAETVRSLVIHKSLNTHIHTQGLRRMGTKNISISDEAYSRLAAKKLPKESFTDVINRLTEKRSILELAGVLTEAESNDVAREIEKLRSRSSRRITSVSEKLK